MPHAADPRIIDLELTNFCNAACAFCPRKAIARPFGLMTDRTFRTIVHQIKEHCPPYVVNFSGMGECLLHPALISCITTMKKELGCLVGITTNGQALTPRLSRELLKAAPDFITISFSGGPKVLENIKRLSLLRTARTPRIHVTIIDGVTAPRSATYWSHIGADGVNLQPLHNRGGHLSTGGTSKNRSRKGGCQIFRHSLFITWEGTVLSCCHDLEGEHCLGDMTQRPLREILKKRSTSLKKHAPFPLCRSCNDVRRYRYFAHGRFLSCRK